MKKGFGYRFIVILIVYLFAAAVIFGSLAEGNALPLWLFWTLFGCFLGLFALTIAINEFIIYRKKRSQHEDH